MVEQILLSVYGIHDMAYDAPSLITWVAAVAVKIWVVVL